MSIYSASGDELFDVSNNALSDDLYDGIYTRPIDPNAAHEMCVVPHSYIYSIDGSLIGPTDFEDDQTKLLRIYGAGNYIGFNMQTGLLHVVNSQSGIYNKVAITEKAAQSRSGKYLFETGRFLYHPSGLMYFVLSIDNNTYSLLFNENCELLWKLQMPAKRQTFSDRGNYMAFFISDKPLSDYGDLLIIDKSGEQISRISDIGAGGYPIEIFEDYDILVVHNNRATWICNFKNGEIIAEYPVGGQNYISYSPDKNYLVKAINHAGVSALLLFNLDDTRRLISISNYQLETPVSKVHTRIHDVSISHDGTEVSVLLNTMYCRLKLTEIEE